MVFSVTKRTLAWIVAMMVALVVAPGMAFADVTAGTMEGGPTWEGVHDTEKDDVAWTDAATDEQKNETVLTVYTQIADEEAITLTSFSRADLLSLAAENTQVLGYEYATKLGATVFVTDKYVTFDQLMNKKLMKGMNKSQISVTPEDALTVSDASGEYGKATFDKAFFDKEGKFFPGIKSMDGVLDFSELGTPQDAPAVIALSWADGALTDGSSAGAVWNDVSPYFRGELRLFNGTTAEELSGDEAALPGGKFSPNGIIGITVKTPASNGFTVLSQDGADAEPVVAKEYTRDTLEPLATDGTKGFLYFGSVWQVGVTTKSVAIEALLADAGLTLDENDTVVFAAPDGFKTTLTAAAIASERYFYPSAVGDQTDDSNPAEVGTVLALNWTAARPNETAGATMIELAEGSLSNQYRLFTGLSAENYANKVAAGNRFATNPKTLTLIKGEKPSTITLADKSATYNGKAVSAAEASVTGSTGDVTYTYYSDAACTEEIAAANVKNVGTYYVIASVAAKDNFAAATSKPAKIVINRAASTITLADKSATYNGKTVSAAKASVTGSAGAVTYTYYSDAACAKKIAAINVKNAGTYYVKASVAVDTNYKAATSKAAKIVINRAASTVTLANKKVTYSAKAVAAAKATVKGSTGKVTYKYYFDAKCTKAIKAAINVKNAGTYYVKASVAADTNYKAATSKAAKIVINKKAQSISAKANVAKAFTGKKSGKTTALAATKTFSLKTLAKVSAKTTVKYAKANTVGGTKITIDKASGKVTVKKGLKKGSYKVKVKLTAAAGTNFKAAAAKAVYVTVKVK